MKIIKTIKKEIKDFRSSGEHLNQIYFPTHDFETNVREMIHLSERSGSGFKIKNQNKILEIITRPLNVLFVFMFLIFLWFPLALCFSDEIRIQYKFIFGIIFSFLIFLLLKISTKTRNHILIDINKRIITIKNNNIFGKFLHSTKVIEFNFVKDIIYKKKSASSKAGTQYYNQVYIVTFDKTIPIIDLPFGPYSFVNQNIFVSILKMIVKESAP